MNPTQQKIISHLEQNGPLDYVQVAKVLGIDYVESMRQLTDLSLMGHVKCDQKNGKYSLRKEVESEC